MLGSGDLSALLQLTLTALALLSGVLLLVRKAASRYFVVDASFEPGEGYDARMSIGGGGGGGGEAASTHCACTVCRAPANKKCSRCKSVWYCSQACQSKHWEAHKLNCKQATLSGKAEIVSSDNDACRRRKSSGLSSISLVPARGTCTVLQEPKKILFPYEEFLKLFNWDKPGFLPCGLLNCGNSCFANVVLQCLASTRPLIAYLSERDHSRGCIRKQDDWCFLCELQVHIQRASASLHPFSPINILSRLPNIGGNLGYGRQEDAHEFMRFAIDTMQSNCLDEFGGEKALDPSTQETTLIQHIFGGHLQSQVTCTKCNMISNRYENMMDLTVEIQGDAESLEECLDQFTIKEWLDGENMYKCDGCNDYVKAWKRLTVHQAPNILTIALKRFQSGRFGKLNKRVTFPENLDLTPYMSGNGDGTDLYTLYAVVVHLDMLNASFFGHYICYTKDYHGRWYKIDDCKVMNVEVEEVLAQGAYMLLYSRRSARREPFIKPMEPARKNHLVEMAPEASKATNHISVDCLPSTDDSQSNLSPCEGPIDVSLYRDTGHERNLSILSNIMKEKESENMDLDIPAEIQSMPVPKDLGDVDMDDSEPSSLGPKDLERKSSISPCEPEDISSVEPVQSNSISPAEISSIKVQAMACKEPCVSSDADMCMEQNTGFISITGEVILSKYTPEDSFPSKNIVYSSASIVASSSVPEPCVSSDADVCIEQDTGQIDIAEETFKLSKYTPEDSFSSKNIAHNVAESSCSASITVTSSVLEPSGDSRANLEQLVVACGPSDNSSGVKTLDDDSCGNKGPWPLNSCWENGSGVKSMPLFSHGFLDRPTRKESAGHDEGIHSGNYGVSHASKVNGYINGHVELDFAEQSVHDDDASLESLSVNGKNILPGSGTSFISCGLLNGVKIAKTGLDKTDNPCNTSCDGSTELNSLEQSVGGNDSSMKFLSANDKDIVPGSCMSFNSQGFLNKPYKQSMNEGTIGKMELDNTDHPCKASCDGSAEPDFTDQSVTENDSSLESLSANGKDIFTGSGMSFISPGFLNKSYNKLMNADKIAKKKLGRTDYPCKPNCNGSAVFSEQPVRDNNASLELHSANGKDILPASGMPFISRGFLNKSYKKSMNADRNAKKELERLDHPCKTNCNGFFAELSSVCQSGNKDYRSDTSLIESNDKGPDVPK